MKIDGIVKPAASHQRNAHAFRTMTSAFALVALLSFAPRVCGIEPIGDDAELFVTGTASVAENDNIFLNHNNAKSATIFDFMPGLSYEYGKNHSLTKIQLAAYEDFQFYSGTGSNSLKNQLENLVFALAYDDQKSKFNIDASYHNADQPQVGLQNLGFLVDRNLIHAGATEEIAFTDKSSASAGVVFDDTDYRTLGFADWRYVEVPLKYYYKVEPKLDLSAGFRFRDNTVGLSGLDSKDLYYNVGARGEFTPNLTGEFDVGYNQQDLNNGHQDGGLGADASFTYAYDPKTSVRFGFADDYGYSASGAAYRNAGPYLGANTLLFEQWSANAQIGYNQYTYLTTSQKDDFYAAQVGLSYLINVHCTVKASYAYAQDNSNITASSFKNNIFTLSVVARF